MIKHWQQIGQEAKDKIARCQCERIEAAYSQQRIAKGVKAILQAVWRVISQGKRILEAEPGLAHQSANSSGPKNKLVSDEVLARVRQIEYERAIAAQK